MSDPRTEKLLRDFLEKEAEERSNGITIASVHRAVQRLADDRFTDRQIIRTHGRAIKTMQHQLKTLTEATPSVPNWKPAPDEITGVHQLAALKEAQTALVERFNEEEERKRDDETWWSRQRWLWFGIGLAALLGSCTAGCVGYALYRVQVIEKQIGERRAP